MRHTVIFAQKKKGCGLAAIDVDLGGGGNAPSIFFPPQNIFLATETKEEQIKKWGDSGGRGQGGVCILTF